ncbi:hypothetical protein D3C85_1272740 [compost metagenome]
MIRLTSTRPTPRPPCLVVKKGLKTIRSCCWVMPLPVSLRVSCSCRRSSSTCTATFKRPPVGMASRALANRLLRICVSNTGWLTTQASAGVSICTWTLLRSSCWANAWRVSSMAATSSTASASSFIGRNDTSRSRTQRDIRSTWLMMSPMFFCAGALAMSWASSALERMLASGLRKLWATAEDISPRAAKVSLATSWVSWVRSMLAARRTIQNRPK